MTRQTPLVLLAACGSDLVIGSRPRPVPRVLAAKTRLWVTARATCPVLPVTAERPPSRPAIQPVPAT